MLDIVKIAFGLKNLGGEVTCVFLRSRVAGLWAHHGEWDGLMLTMGEVAPSSSTLVGIQVCVMVRAVCVVVSLDILAVDIWDALSCMRLPKSSKSSQVTFGLNEAIVKRFKVKRCRCLVSFLYILKEPDIREPGHRAMFSISFTAFTLQSTSCSSGLRKDLVSVWF